MIEKWQGIPEYEGKYQVSNLGRLKRTQDGLILKPMKATNGYLIACLWKNNKQKKTVVHQLVARAFVPNPHNYNEVNHKDENKTNNNADNLEWCSHKYNMNYGKVKEKISKANSGRVASPETLEKLKKDTSRRRWVNNGKIEKYVYIEDMENWLSMPNWQKGRLYHERRFLA